MNAIRTVAGLATLTLVVGCGAAPVPQDQILVVLPRVPDVTPEWTMGAGKCPDAMEAKGGAATVVVMKATGDLVDNPDVLLDMMGLQGRAALAQCVKAKIIAEAQGSSEAGNGDKSRTVIKRTASADAHTDATGETERTSKAAGGLASNQVRNSKVDRAFESLASAGTELTLYGSHQAGLYENGKGRVWALWVIKPEGLSRTFLGAGVDRETAEAMADRLARAIKEGH